MGGATKDLAYTLRMAVQALKEAIELFSEPSEASLHPTSGAPGLDTYDEMRGHNRNLASMFHDRTVKVVEQKQRINRDFEALARENPELVAQSLIQLNDAIAAFDPLIEASKTTLISQQAEADRLLAQAAALSVASARLVRREVNKFFDIGRQIHNETVEFYYFLLALKAEYDPDSRGGDIIESAQDLEKFFAEMDL